MNRLAIEKNENRKILKRDKILNYIKIVLYVIGFVTCIYTGRQYNFTIISFWKFLLIGLIPGIIATFILVKNYKSFLLSFILFGCFFAWIFFLINGSSTNPVITLKQPIIEKIAGGRYGPYVTIQYNGIEKTIAVDVEGNSAQFKHALYLNLTVKKGTFGYYIIKDRKLE